MNYAQYTFKLVWLKDLYGNLIFLCPNLQEIIDLTNNNLYT